MRVAGIDLGKRRWTLAAIPLGVRRPMPVVVTVKTKIQDPLEAARYLAGRLRWYIEEMPELADLKLVYLEEPWGAQRQQLVDLATVLGALTASLPDDIEAKRISPDEWRKTIGVAMRGSKVKHETQLWVQAAFEGGPWDEDESDALAIAWVARNSLRE